MSGYSMAYNIGFIFGSLAMVSIIFSMVFCTVRSIQTKKNLYNIPAGLAFILMSVIILLGNFEYYISFFRHIDYYDSMDCIIQLLYILQYLVFFPLLGILILSKANKGSLLAPIILLILPYTTSFFNYIEYYDSIEIILYLIWLLAFVSLIVLIFARKYLKYAFFVPALFMLTNCFMEYIEYHLSFESIIIYDFWMITGLLLLGAYIVCDYPEKKKAYIATPAPQPVYTLAPQPVYTNYPPQNSGNNYRQQPQQIDYMQELAKYKNMLDQGLITEADYEQMKKQLLGL